MTVKGHTYVKVFSWIHEDKVEVMLLNKNKQLHIIHLIKRIYKIVLWYTKTKLMKKYKQNIPVIPIDNYNRHTNHSANKTDVLEI